MRARGFFLAGVALIASYAQADEGALASGRLETGGLYLTSTSGATVSMLRDGSVLVYGFGPSVDERIAQREQTAALRGRLHARRIPAVDPEPKIWEAATRTWKRLPPAPECQAFQRYLHTATVLADGRVLIAGGLCDVAKLADDPTPYAAHTRVSLWDTAASKWVEGPSLREARIHHTATLMPDGSALIVGGENDPALSDAPEPVLNSIERFKANAIEPGPPLMQARARHTATLMPDGALMVAGGFDGGTRAIGSVEILDAGATAWRALPPMREARHSHTATLLADGRVLVAGGKDAQDRALASTEIWDPARNEWLSGPALPVALNAHAAARLQNGEVLVAGGAWIESALARIPWAWTWSPATADWRTAGHAMPRDATDLSGGVSIVPREDNTALVFTPRAILRWRPGYATPGPLWDSFVSIAPLKGARAMVVGHETGADANDAIARVWDSATRQWTIAGVPTSGESMDGATAQLPSGAVIHVGVNMRNTVVCRMWEPPDRWSDCGSLKLEYAHRGRPRIATVPDGRTFAIFGEHEAAIFDEPKREWTPARLEWSRDGFAYGAPVRKDKPFARLIDASGAAIDIDDAGARYHIRNLSGGNVSMLWDARASRWAYVFLDRRMGWDAQWLPDGCAISTNPLAVFDPREGDARRLIDPGIGIEPHQGAMAVLDDGTVIVAGVSPAAKDWGAGFFSGKASCAGFAARDATYITPDVGGLMHPAPPPVQAKPAPKPMGFAEWVERVKSEAFQRRWLLLAILAPLALYALLRRTRIGKARAPASRGFRVVIYVILAIVLAPFVLQFALFYFTTSARDCVESRAECESKPPWWIALLRRAKPEEPAPCDLVGVWSVQRGQSVRKIELKDDGTYEMPPGDRDNHRYTGRWRVDGGKLAWHHDQSPYDRDVNPLERLTATRFKLTERNGQTTHYERIGELPRRQCKP